MAKKSTKRALIASICAALLCASLAVGGTLAWFTDSDTTSVATIQAGTLDVELVDTNGEVLGGEDGKAVLNFLGRTEESEELTVSDILWEPGATFRTADFNVKNVGTLALEYKIRIDGDLVSKNKLAEAIDFYLCTVDAEGNHIKTPLQSTEDGDIDGKLLLPNSMSTTPMHIEATMQTSAGNEYQGLTLDGITITVFAKQAVSEFDSSVNDYDKDATYADQLVTVKDAASFVEAAKNLKSGTIITLANDIDMTNVSWTPIDNKSYTLDGNGHTITGLNGGMTDHVGSGEITIKNVTFDKMVDNSTTNYAGLIGDADTCSYIKMENVTITDANISSADWAGGFAAYTSGYGNDYDGPVNASHNFTNCTITDSTIHSTGDGSVGGLIGHAGGNPATTTNISGFTQSNLTLTQATSRPEKSGNILGTAGCGIVNIDTADNATDIGRFVPQSTGKLVINGVEQQAFANK